VTATRPPSTGSWARWTAVLGAGLLLGCASEDPPCAAPAALGTALRADGTVLRDELDRVVTLRGVNFGGRSKFAPYVPVDVPPGAEDPLAAYVSVLEPTLDTLVDWGVVTLRVPWSWAALEPTAGTWDEAWLARLDALLDGAAARRLDVVLDLHQDIYAEPFCGDGVPVWTLPGDPGPPRHDCPNWFLAYFSDEDVKAAFDRLWANEGGLLDRLGDTWAFMVTRYADHPAVIGYEPLNEPGWGSMDRNTFTATVLPAWYEALVPRLQALDPEALFFLDTNGVDGAEVSTAMPRPELDGFVFAPHFYHPSLVLGDDAPPIEDDAADALVAWADVGEEWQVPILLGEFGIPIGRAGELPWIRSHYEAFDALGMHATHWEVSRSVEVWNGERLSLMTPGGAAEPVVDEVARPWVRAASGAVTSREVDVDAGTATFGWSDPSGGVTELVVPDRGWGDAELSVDGGCIAAREAGRVSVRATAETTRVTLLR
jgi:endoglycosylceramidase